MCRAALQKPCDPRSTALGRQGGPQHGPNTESQGLRCNDLPQGTSRGH